MGSDSGTPPVEATMTSARIVDALGEGPAGVTELATRLGMHKSTVYKHLSTLERIGYVRQCDGGFRLGSRLVQLGEASKRQADFYGRARSVIDQLAATTEEFVGLTLEADGRVYDVYTARGRLALQGERSPVTAEQLHCSAAGKAILAQYSEDQLREYLESAELSAATERTITDPETLVEAVERIREREIAFDREEQRAGVRSVAAPYTDDLLSLYGAVYVLGPADRLTGKRFEEDIPGMIHGAVEKIRSNRE